MSLLSQPFLDHPEVVPIPQEYQPAVDEVYEWMKAQSRFSKFNKNHAYLFVHACYGDVPSSKRALLRYVQIRLSSPDLFENRDMMLEQIQFVYDMTHMVGLPLKTPEGYNILVYRLSDSDPSKMHFGNAIKAFCMFNDVRISEDVITEGYVVVFDMKGLRFGHLTRIQLGPLRTFMAYIQEAHPVRLKKIYIVHTSFFINQIMTLVKPLMRGELMSLLKFTSLGPSDVLPSELLPVDYGGPLERLEKMHKQQRQMIERRYRQWLIESALSKPSLIDSSKGKTTVTLMTGASTPTSISTTSGSTVNVIGENIVVDKTDCNELTKMETKFSSLEVD